MILETFAERLYNMDRIIDVNLNAQKTPILIVCSENERLSLLNIFKKYDGNEPVIFASKGFNIDNFKVLKTDAPFVSDKVYEIKVKIWNEALTFLGISNIQFNKKERMLSNEVDRLMGGTTACRKSRIKPRQQACERINAMFGTNIECEFDENVDVEMRGEGDLYLDEEEVEG